MKRRSLVPGILAFAMVALLAAAMAMAEEKGPARRAGLESLLHVIGRTP